MFIKSLLKLIPASTDGPSGPRLFPVARVAVAASALRKNRLKSFLSDGGGISFVHNISSAGAVAPDALIESRSTVWLIEVRNMDIRKDALAHI